MGILIGSPGATTNGGSSPVGLGHFVDHANYTSLAVAIPTDSTPYVFDAGDVFAGDSTLDPEDSNAFEMPVDGLIPLTPGTYYLYASANVDYDTAPDPDVGMAIILAFAGADVRLAVLSSTLSPDDLTVPSLVLGENALYGGARGDDAATSLSAEMAFVVQVAADCTVSLAVETHTGGPGGVPDPTLTNAELQIMRSA